MINRIGVIYQDINSVAFLEGLRDRLKCAAKFIKPPAAIGKSRVLTRRQARLAWLYFQGQGVDLVVRFTDADRHSWQDTKREELQRVPSEAQSIWICGVAVENVEDWLCLDEAYLAQKLDVDVADLPHAHDRSGFIKRRIASLRGETHTNNHVIADIVRGASSSVFRRWFRDVAFRNFYTECRAAATQADCETPNELATSEYA